MIRLEETATTSLTTAEAYANVGEFANIQEWDPGVISSTKTSDEPTGVGTVYDMDLSYGGRVMKMQYRVTAIEPGKRVVLEGSGGVVKAIDSIEFESIAGETKVTYTADLGLKGIARLIEPFMKGRFAEIGRSTGEGLRSWLAELEKQTEAS
ncbi:MAG: SRPBCC family protein [Acidimicrobiia bacterium]|nr:SRPBCC family protein [Acidimicrobiia bacterium]MDX2466097.1 SRPBCC family protein [Acidimicrobiia bacterium]